MSNTGWSLFDDPITQSEAIAEGVESTEQSPTMVPKEAFALLYRAACDGRSNEAIAFANDFSVGGVLDPGQQWQLYIASRSWKISNVEFLHALGFHGGLHPLAPVRDSYWFAEAAFFGDVDFLKYLVGRIGSDSPATVVGGVYRDKATPLYRAMCNFHVGAVKYLLSVGFDPLANTEDTSRLFEWACRSPSMLDLLCSECLRVDYVSRTSDTLLSICIRTGSQDGISYLISQGCDVNAKTGRLPATPLFCASVLFNSDILQLLLDAGADPTILSFNDKDPYSAARTDEFRAILSHEMSETIMSFYYLRRDVPLHVRELPRFYKGVLLPLYNTYGEGALREAFDWCEWPGRARKFAKESFDASTSDEEDVKEPLKASASEHLTLCELLGEVDARAAGRIVNIVQTLLVNSTTDMPPEEVLDVATTSEDPASSPAFQKAGTGISKVNKEKAVIGSLQELTTKTRGEVEELEHLLELLIEQWQKDEEEVTKAAAKDPSLPAADGVCARLRHSFNMCQLLDVKVGEAVGVGTPESLGCKF